MIYLEKLGEQGRHQALYQVIWLTFDVYNFCQVFALSQWKAQFLQVFCQYQHRKKNLFQRQRKHYFGMLSIFLQQFLVSSSVVCRLGNQSRFETRYDCFHILQKNENQEECNLKCKFFSRGRAAAVVLSKKIKRTQGIAFYTYQEVPGAIPWTRLLGTLCGTDLP